MKVWVRLTPSISSGRESERFADLVDYLAVKGLEPPTFRSLVSVKSFL